MVSLLKEGRSSLVSGFVSFKFMELYGMIQFLQSAILFNFASNLFDKQFLYNDVFVIIPLVLLVGTTGTY